MKIESRVINSFIQENAEISILYLYTNSIFSKSETPECIDKTLSEIVQEFLQMKAEWTLQKVLSLTVSTIYCKFTLRFK